MPISDFSVLTNLRNLEHLDVSYSNFSDFKLLLKMPHLKSLTIEMSKAQQANLLDKKVRQGLKINFR